MTTKTFTRGEAESGLFTRGEAESGLFTRGEAESGLFTRGEAESGLFTRGKAESRSFTRSGARQLNVKEIRQRLRSRHYELTLAMKHLEPEKAYRYFLAAEKLWACRERLLKDDRPPYRVPGAKGS